MPVQSNSFTDAAGTGPSGHPNGILGVLAGTTPGVGQIGETIVAVDSSTGAIGVTGTFVDLVSILLTEGRWSISANEIVQANANADALISLAISQYSGNTTTDHVAGYNSIQQWVPNGVTSINGGSHTMAITPLPVNVSAPTTYYLKMAATDVNNRHVAGKLVATRIA